MLAPWELWTLQGKTFFTCKSAFLDIQNLTIWLVGRTLRLRHWNGNQFYSSIIPNAHDTTLAPASYYGKPDLYNKQNTSWVCIGHVGQVRHEIWIKYYPTPSTCMKRVMLLNSVTNSSPLISKTSCVTKSSVYVANVLLSQYLVLYCTQLLYAYVNSLAVCIYEFYFVVTGASSTYMYLWLSLSMYRLWHAGSWNLCTPWSDLCITVYWHAWFSRHPNSKNWSYWLSAIKIFNEDR